MLYKDINSYNSKDYISNPGTPTLAKYAFEVDKKTGVEELKPTGEYEYVHDRIQADYPSTDINILMQRFALGETDILNVREGFFADVTKMPSNYAELFALDKQAEQYFESLPTDVKEMFDNSYKVFFAEMDNDSKSFNDKIEKYNSRFELSPEFDEKSDIKNESEVVINE